MPAAAPEAPVLLIVFNRPDLTRATFAAIARARPSRLLIAADGPRPDRPGEDRLCREARDVVAHVDWECVVEYDFSDRNLGCRDRISSAIDWAFSKTDRLIILEDDCLPSPSFFEFAGSLLEVYKDDERIGAICGSRLVGEPTATEVSYGFTRYPLVWGWATWKRVWDRYDRDISDWGARRTTDWLKWQTYPEEFDHWVRAFDGVYEHRIDTWDYQFVYCLWKNHQLSIQPRHNLISNTGFRPDATHTKQASEFGNRATVDMRLPLVHPDGVFADGAADMAYRQKQCVRPPRRRRPLRRLLARLGLSDRRQQP